MPPRLRKWLFFMALPVLAATALWQTRLETDLSAFFIAGTDEEEAFLASTVQSGELSRRYILSLGRRDGGNAGLRDGAETFAAALRALPEIDRVWFADQPLVEPERLIGLYARYAAQRYSLKPETEAPVLFRKDNLARRAEALRQALLSPQARLAKSAALTDPLLLSLDGFRAWGEAFARRSPTADRHVNLFVESRAQGLDAEAQNRLQQAMEAQFQGVDTTHGHAFTLEYTGVPVFAVAAQRQIKGDIQTVSAASSVAIILLFLGIFRSLSAMRWVFMILVAAVAAATLATQWLFGQVHGLTLALGATLLGVCIDYPIHTLAHAHGTAPALRRSVIARIWPSLLLGATTTLIGYTALGFSGYPGFRQIALFAGTGIIAALLLSRFVLPALIGDRPGHRPHWRILQVWIRFCGRRRRHLLVLLGLCILASIACLPRLAWLDDLEKLTTGLESLRQQDRAIRARLTSIEPGRFVLVKGRDLETALAKAEAVYPALESLKQAGKLENYFGLYPWLLSEQLQRRNLRAFQAQLTEPNLVRWHQILEARGLSSARLGDLTPDETEPLSAQAVLASPVKDLISGQLIHTADYVLVVIWLGNHQVDALEKRLATLGGARYFSQRDMLNRLAARYQARATEMLLLGLGVIFTLLLLRYRHPGPALRALAPALLSALFILAGWALAGHPVSFLHIVGFLLAIAICVDYGIFFLENPAADRAITYQAMGVSMLTTLAAFGALSLAQNPTLKALAAAVSLGVVIGYILCPIIIDSRGEVALSPKELFH